jgi:hypothetical protein
MAVTLSDSAKQIRELRIKSAATLASAMVVVSGRPHSAAEVVALCNDLRMALRRPDNTPRYQQWKKTHDPKIVHK